MNLKSGVFIEEGRGKVRCELASSEPSIFTHPHAQLSLAFNATANGQMVSFCDLNGRPVILGSHRIAPDRQTDSLKFLLTLTMITRNWGVVVMPKNGYGLEAGPSLISRS